MPRHAQHERAALCDTLSRVGPDAPTLCEGWVTRDLAAHLLVRERRPDAAAGMFLPPLARHRARVESTLASRDWEQTVGVLRGGPPRWSVFAIPAVDEMANLGEFFVHHEDVRRAVDGVTPRELGPDGQRALWAGLARVGRVLLRKVPVGVVAQAPGVDRRVLHKAPDGHGDVLLTGEPAEILLYVFGRGAVAQVALDGAAGDLEAFRAAKLGI